MEVVTGFIHNVDHIVHQMKDKSNTGKHGCVVKGVGNERISFE